MNGWNNIILLINIILVKKRRKYILFILPIILWCDGLALIWPIFHCVFQLYVFLYLHSIIKICLNHINKYLIPFLLHNRLSLFFAQTNCELFSLVNIILIILIRFNIFSWLILKSFIIIILLKYLLVLLETKNLIFMCLLN